MSSVPTSSFSQWTLLPASLVATTCQLISVITGDIWWMRMQRRRASSVLWAVLTLSWHNSAFTTATSEFPRLLYMGNECWYANRWRDFGLLWAYVVFNIIAAVGIYWLARVVRTFRLFTQPSLLITSLISPRTLAKNKHLNRRTYRRSWFLHSLLRRNLSRCLEAPSLPRRKIGRQENRRLWSLCFESLRK